MIMPSQIHHLKWIIIAVFIGIFLVLSSELTQAQSFEFSQFNTGSTKIAGIPFEVTITAKNASNDLDITYNGQVYLNDTTGTLYPTQTSNFVNGVWHGMLYVTRAGNNNRILADFSGRSGQSEIFSVAPDARYKFIGISSGNNQTRPVGNTLNEALVARVTDSLGNPLANVAVNYTIASSPTNDTFAEITQSGGTSDANGYVSASFKLGHKAGVYIISATITDEGFHPSVQFFATASPGNLIILSIKPYLSVIPAGGYLPFEAFGYDQYFNETAAPPVTWSVQNGGGTIDPTGIFHSGMVLGNFTNTIKAVVGSVSSTANVSVVDVYRGTSTASGPGAGYGTGIAATVSATPNPQAGVLYNVQIEPDVLSILQNARIPILAEGVDFFGNPVSGVTYDFQTTGDLGSLVQTGANSALLTGSATGMGTVNITATQGTITKTATVVGSVGAGMNRRLVIEEVATPQQVGEPFTLSIAAKDTLNNFITDYKGPLVIADTTGTIDPAVVQPSDQGIWYVQAIISVANPEVSITVAGDGMVGVSNVFEVQGSPKKSDLGLSLGFGGGVGDVLGASISAKISEIMKSQDLNKYSVVRYIGAGLAAGFGILGASVGGGLMASKGLEAIGRNPFAKGRLQANLYVSLVVFIAAASLAVFASVVIMK